MHPLIAFILLLLVVVHFRYPRPHIPLSEEILLCSSNVAYAEYRFYRKEYQGYTTEPGAKYLGQKRETALTG